MVRVSLSVSACTQACMIVLQRVSKVNVLKIELRDHQNHFCEGILRYTHPPGKVHEGVCKEYKNKRMLKTLFMYVCVCVCIYIYIDIYQNDS